MKQETGQTTDKEVSELLRHIEPEKLAQFVAEYAHRNASFRSEIFKHFRPQEPQVSLDDYRKEASDCFVFDGYGRYGRGYNFYEAAYMAGAALCTLLEKGNYLFTQNNYEETAAIAQSIIEVIPRNYELVDDSDGELVVVFNDAVELLLAIVGDEKADEALKTKIFHWVSKEVKEDIYSDYGFDEIDSLLIPYTQASGLFNDALDLAEERIHQATDDYRLESAVMNKIHLLQQNGLTYEMEDTINQYMELPGIRKMKLTGLLEQDRYSEAIMILKEGINLAQQKNHPGTVSDWKDQLLEIYILLKDHKNVVKSAEDLFYNGRDAMKYYHLLKKETEPENWTTRLEALLSRRKKDSLMGFPNHVRAQIYIEEEYWDRLLHLVENASIDGLQTYEKYLKPRFPGDLMHLYMQKITEYAAHNMGRNHYRYVADMLKKLRSYPDGNRTVDQLLAEFKIKYKARRAMMEELNGV